METKKLKKQGEEFKFQGDENSRFKDLKFKIQNSSNCSKSNCNILWLQDDDL